MKHAILRLEQDSVWSAQDCCGRCDGVNDECESSWYFIANPKDIPAIATQGTRIIIDLVPDTNVCKFIGLIVKKPTMSDVLKGIVDIMENPSEDNSVNLGKYVGWSVIAKRLLKGHD